MASRSLHTVLRHLRRFVADPANEAITDGQLLDRFTRHFDEEAFATLMRRHGGMVLGVCRRLLGPGPDAEDVFQAAFLVLARKAGSGHWRDSVGPWLHEVACRLSLKSRAEASRRQAVERQYQPAFVT